MATEYLILRSASAAVDGAIPARRDDVLIPLGLSEGRDGEHAIKRLREANVDEAILAADDGEVEWHAVPTSKWTTIGVATETPEPVTTYKDKPIPKGFIGPVRIDAPVAPPIPLDDDPPTVDDGPFNNESPGSEPVA